MEPADHKTTARLNTLTRLFIAAAPGHFISLAPSHGGGSKRLGDNAAAIARLTIKTQLPTVYCGRQRDLRFFSEAEADEQAGLLVRPQLAVGVAESFPASSGWTSFSS